MKISKNFIQYKKYIFLFLISTLLIKILKKINKKSIDMHKINTEIPDNVGISVVIIILINIIIKKNIDFYKKFAMILCTLWSIFDDFYDLLWRYKILFALITSFFIIFYEFKNEIMSIKTNKIKNNSIKPNKIKRININRINKIIIKYIIIILISTFNIHSVNILAGINGIEITQYLIIILFLLPFIKEKNLEFNYIISTMPLFFENFYPSSCFIGNTFCFFSGALISLFSFYNNIFIYAFLLQIIQLFNFFLFLLQYFFNKNNYFPRHRMPDFKNNLLYDSNNLTILNFLLFIPMKELNLYFLFTFLQFFICFLIFLIKYYYF